MSHHRETVHAEGAPKAAGPYSHAVISNGLIFLSGQTPVDPATGALVDGSIGDQTRRCLDNLAVVAAAAGALPELVDPDALVAPGDADALAAAARARFGDERAGAAGLARIRELAAPAAVAERLRAVY
jgi:enamine deaminase RidA (YjgF/YER057c/UK114 family)